jgi:hypothetical protein
MPTPPHSLENKRPEFSAQERTFIAQAENDLARQYRQEFIEKSIQLLTGSGAVDPKVDFYKKFFYRAILTDKGQDDLTAIAQIDAGKFPAQHFVHKQGFEAISKKQFASSMKTLRLSIARSVALKNQRAIATAPEKTPFSLASMNIKEALSWSKLPPQWLSLDGGDNNTLFETENNDFVAKHTQQLNALKPYLLNTGKQLDHLQAKQDKPGQKALVQQWKWLSQRSDRPLGAILDDMDNKYRLKQTWEDYPKIIADLLHGVMLRSLMSFPEIDRKDPVVILGGALSVNAFQVLDNLICAKVLSPDEYQRSESFRLLSSHDIKEHLEQQGTHFKEMVEKNHEQHMGFNALVMEFNNTDAENFKSKEAIQAINWGAFIEDRTTIGDFTIESISDKTTLLEEGREMSHCVFSYLSKCLTGDSMILSVRDPVSTQRLATIELNKDKDDPEKYVINQCLGFGNEDVDPALRADVDHWMEKINKGVLPVNHHTGIGNERDDMLAKIAANPLQHGHALCTVPYQTDAVYLAYFAAQASLPKGMDVDTIMSARVPAFYDFFQQTPLAKELNALQALSNSLQCDPQTVVRFKIEHHLETIEAIAPLWKHMGERNALVDELISRYVGDLSVGQLARTVNEHLGQQFGCHFEEGAIEHHLEKGGTLPDPVYMTPHQELISPADVEPPVKAERPLSARR